MANVHAYPRKQFFLEMFTRDISLEDCVLDLIDNSMDSLLRSRNIDIEAQVLGAAQGGQTRAAIAPAQIIVKYSESQFDISDNCGGISKKEAEDEVFCFGHSSKVPTGRLGVYGIGMKRAIFKIGNTIEVTSRTTESSFTVSIDVLKWSQKDTSLEDWTFPITKVEAGVPLSKAGTSITIKDLRPEVKVRMNDGTLDAALSNAIGHTYPAFLDSLVKVKINKVDVDRSDLPFGGSGDIKPGIDKFEEDGVKVTLLATLAPMDKRTQEIAGWYVLCNGRVVVLHDKSDLTGWGIGLPAFHSKYRGFVGVALFTSANPMLLPWNTSKRGLNREAVIYQKARNRMAGVSRPVITFLNEMYPSDLPERHVEREIASRVVQQDFRPLISAQSKTFEVIRPVSKKKTMRAQFDVDIADIERIRKKLRRPGMSASSIGRYTLDHYLKTECPE